MNLFSFTAISILFVFRLIWNVLPHHSSHRSSWQAPLVTLIVLTSVFLHLSLHDIPIMQWIQQKWNTINFYLLNTNVFEIEKNCELMVHGGYVFICNSTIFLLFSILKWMFKVPILWIIIFTNYSPYKLIESWQCINMVT